MLLRISAFHSSGITLKFIPTDCEIQIREGFIVDEDEEEEERRHRRRDRKRRRHEQREQEDELLDEEDLDLIGENNPDYRPSVTSEVCNTLLSFTHPSRQKSSPSNT